MSMWIYSGFGKPLPKISRCATAAEKQRLLEEAALSEGALRKQETEALCERFIAAES